ncbi:hypothetical protein A2Z00_05675 [Candidatus Gottesmanbacteria bacterium RBG_13_45_10]|uniref:Amine oxidase domain-containing protein n=1 Tax=Candidatus Gottesmanbacteria bacterium RBG_13_45_10 TaxID=1798370 RepID=A0A1F5ZGB9_9BACT|nr:MAG: hypothetical protein A2Z00_05675 [Candidatus Gottesmanbacteria bacterium RBG_13_45_10]
MDIAIIGGGITGLTAAYELTKKGHHVVVFERDPVLGGLAHGFKRKGWDWSLEKTYHHLFTNDNAIINLIDELGIHDKLIIKRPITATLFTLKGEAFKGSPQIFQLDSPTNLLSFPLLSPIDKLRTGTLLAFLKLNPFWQPLESITAQKLFTFWGGSTSWRILWEPLMVGKFGEFAPTIQAAWLWARIKKRTPSLVYIEGGFQTFIQTLANTISLQGGIIYTNTQVMSIKKSTNSKSANLQIAYKKFRNNLSFDICHLSFDKVLLTTPSPIAFKLLPKVRSTMNDQQSTSPIPHLHAQVLVLETRKPILQDVYWLSITDRTFPFLAVVAHTNFMDKKHYGNHHLTYVGNYLPDNHPYLSMTKEQLLKKFLPFIKRITDDELRITNSYVFTAPFAQPVHQLHYSKRAPKLVTPIPGVFLANMDSIYPWDRGTNYAVELGQKAAKTIENL